MAIKREIRTTSGIYDEYVPIYFVYIRFELIKPEGSVVVLMENEYDDHDNNNNFLLLLLHVTDRRMDR